MLQGPLQGLVHSVFQYMKTKYSCLRIIQITSYLYGSYFITVVLWQTHELVLNAQQYTTLVVRFGMKGVTLLRLLQSSQR